MNNIRNSILGFLQSAVNFIGFAVRFQQALLNGINKMLEDLKN